MSIDECRRVYSSIDNFLYHAIYPADMADDIQPTKKANPAPLGLLGFGMTTVLLSLHNADVLALDGVTLAMGIFVGGLAQVLAGIMEYKNGNTFGTVAFTLYGMFWLTFVATHAGIEGMSGSGETLGTWLLLWGILTLFLFIGTLKGRKSLMFVFATLTVTFFLLSAGNLGSVDGLVMAGGAVGVVCGLAAMYTAFAEVLAEQHGKEILPF